MATGEHEDSIMRRGVRLLWLSVRAQPKPFALAVAGATLFALMAVGGTIVLGKVVDEVLAPAFEEGGVERRTVAIGAAAIVGASVLRMVGVVFRRYFGQMAQRRMQVLWFRRVTDRYLAVPLRWFDDRPTGELLAHADADCERSTMAMQPLPFSLGVVVIIVVSMVHARVRRPGAARRGARRCSRAWPSSTTPTRSRSSTRRRPPKPGWATSPRSPTRASRARWW